jgi:predicted AAA+ superfamily ATPase
METLKFARILKLPQLLAKKSFFLFGPRATGKSFLIRNELSTAKRYDLLDAQTFTRLSRQPSLIGETTFDTSSPIVIDEIQKLPSLLDEVHRLIEERNLTFLLTGSSARRLRRGGVNLLAGRAGKLVSFHLYRKNFPIFH